MKHNFYSEETPELIKVEENPTSFNYNGGVQYSKATLTSQNNCSVSTRNTTTASYSICEMRRQRTIEAKPVPLPTYMSLPKSENYVTRLPNQNGLPALAHIKNNLTFVPSNGDVSDSDNSMLTNDSLFDSGSILSDTIPEDFERTVSLSFKPSSDEETDTLQSVFGDFSLKNNQDVRDSNILSDNSIYQKTQNEFLSLPCRLPNNTATDNLIVAATESRFLPLPDVPDVPDASISDSVDQLSDVTTFTCSSMSLDQDGLLLSEEFAAHNNSDSTVCSNDNTSTLNIEIRRLKQSLKLSQADTAILVSAKQQLQLDYQEACENLIAIKRQLIQVATKATQHEKKLAILKSTLKHDKETYLSELLHNEEHICQLKQKNKDITADFEKVNLEKLEVMDMLNETKGKASMIQMQNNNLQKELDSITSQNAKLSLLVTQSTDDNIATQSYIKLIRSDRDEYAKQLSESNQQCIEQQMSIQRLQESILQLNESKDNLSFEKDNLAKSVLDYKGLNKSLEDQLSIKLKEKENLDGVVSRLHGDLSKVEAGFITIKKEIALKSNFVEKGQSDNSKMKLMMSKLESDTGHLKENLTTQTQRVNDKNNQIEQLICQIKSSNEERNLALQEVVKIQCTLAEKENSLSSVAAKEHELCCTLQEKSLALIASKNNYDKLSDALEAEILKVSVAKAELDKTTSKVYVQNGEIDKLKLELHNIKKQQNRPSDHEASQLTIKCLTNEVQQLQHKIEDTSTSVGNGNSKQDLSSRQALLVKLQNERQELHEKVDIQTKQIEIEASRHQVELHKLNLKLGEIESNHSNIKMVNSKLKNDYDEKLNELQKQCKEIKQENIDLQKALLTVNTKWEKEMIINSDLEKVSRNQHQQIHKLSSKIKNLTEELVTVKQEMNTNALKLLEELQLKSMSTSNDQIVLENSCFGELAQAIEERDKLRQAVTQQQRYIVSLQTYYQQWAQTTSDQLKKSVDKSKIAADPRDSGFIGKACSQGASHMRDTSTQTEHDNKPCTPTSSPFKHSRNQMSQPINQLGVQTYCDVSSSRNIDSSFLSQDSIENSIYQFSHHSKCSTCGRCLPLISTVASTQTDHNLQPIFSGRYHLESQVSANVASQTEQDLLVSSVCIAGTQTLVSLKGVFDSSSQTDHKEICCTGIKTNKITTQLEQFAGSLTAPESGKTVFIKTGERAIDKSSQTDHDELLVGPDVFRNSVPKQLVNSVFVQTLDCSPWEVCNNNNAAIPSTSTVIQTDDVYISPPPNLSDVARILSSTDGRKLKAYKNTVQVLKKKLKIADSKLADQELHVKNLQAQLNSLNSLSKSNLPDVSDMTFKSVESNEYLEKQLCHWKGVAETKEYEVTSLQNEIDKIKTSHERDNEKYRRKGLVDRMQHERKIKESNARIYSLVEANAKLRRTVEKLQVKVTSCGQQLEIARRDKLRYQHRSRKLQADLRSLSWLANPSEEKDTNSPASCLQQENGTNRHLSSLEIPPTVRDVEEILTTLKCEISSLERQLIDHSAVVNQSKTARLRSYSNSPKIANQFMDPLGEIV